MRLLLAIFVSLVLISCNQHGDSVVHDKRDKNEYRILAVNSTTWMADNLKHLNENIYNSGAWVWGSDEEDYEKAQDLPGLGFCVVYNHETANSVCPDGWHLPSALEWEGLISFYKESGGGSPDFYGFNLSFEGKARAYDKYCIFNGDTYWTSDSSDDCQEGVSIAIQLTPEGKVICIFESSGKENAFYVRCIKNSPE